jgi:hypothetical protein
MRHTICFTRPCIIGLILVAAISFGALVISRNPHCGIIQHWTGHKYTNIRDVPVSLPQVISTVNDRNGDQLASAASRVILTMHPSDSISSVSNLLHYMYFWGTLNSVYAPHAAGIGMNEMLDVLLNGSRPGWYLPEQAPFFLGQDGFIRVARTNEISGEAHLNQTLATLGAIGVNSSRPIGCLGGPFTVADAVRSSIATFSLVDEIEWSTLALLYYLPPQRAWQNRWGETFTFDEIARVLMARPLGQGSCAGTHVLFVLSLMMRVNEQYPIISQESVHAIEQYVSAACQLLQSNQHSTGGWTTSWQVPLTSRPSSTSAREMGGNLLVTGHHLEWIAIAPGDIRPRTAAIQRAVRWCMDELTIDSADALPKDVCARTHAVRAILLLLNRIEEESPDKVGCLGK